MVRIVIYFGGNFLSNLIWLVFVGAIARHDKYPVCMAMNLLSD
jgi:hypothetical protein